MDGTTHLGDLERMADLLRRDHPCLSTTWLEPDGKYQTRGVALDALTREVRDRLSERLRAVPADEFPTLYCGWGKARVGSTALINLFGVAGLASYYQPIKAMLRHALTGGDGAAWQVPRRSVHPQVFIKDVAGPYLLAECLYIPLQLLVEAGYPPDRLHLVLLDRQPISALASWIGKWSDRVSEAKLVRHYVLAALNAVRVEAYARRQGVATTHYVYEASKDAVRSIQALFDRLGLAQRFTATAVTEWNEKGQLESGNAPIIFPDKPAVYDVPGLHGSDTAYRFRQRSTGSITEAHRALLARTGVDAVYSASVLACAADLRLDAAARGRLFAECTVGDGPVGARSEARAQPASVGAPPP